MVSGDAPAERFAGVRHASRSDQPPSVIRELARRGAVIGKATASHPRHPRHRPHQLAHLWWQSPAHYHYRSRHCPLAADSITPHWLINFFRDQNDPDCPAHCRPLARKMHARCLLGRLLSKRANPAVRQPFLHICSLAGTLRSPGEIAT